MAVKESTKVLKKQSGITLSVVQKIDELGNVLGEYHVVNAGHGTALFSTLEAALAEFRRLVKNLSAGLGR